MMKRSGLVGAVALLTLAVPTAVFAGPYSGPPSVTVDDPTPPPGKPLVITLTGFQPGETIVVVDTCGGTSRVTADETGEAVVQLTAPDAERTCTVTGTGESSDRTDSAEYAVEAIAPLPEAGSDSSSILLTATELTVIGATFVTVSLVRRRRRATA